MSRLIDADEIRIKPDFIFYGVCGTPVIRCEDLARIINNMPTIEPQKWIPCTPETMPEEAGAYLCTCKDAERLIITLIKWQPRMKSWGLTGARTYWKVIAWMPLPEPWGGDSDDNH